MSELWDEIKRQRSDFEHLPTVIVGNKNDSITKKVGNDSKCSHKLNHVLFECAMLRKFLKVKIFCFSEC